MLRIRPNKNISKLFPLKDRKGDILGLQGMEEQIHMRDNNDRLGISHDTEDCVFGSCTQS